MLGSMNSDETTYLSVAESAKYVRSGVSTVRTWIREKRVPACRIGRRLFIRRADLERLMVAAAGGAR